MLEPIKMSFETASKIASKNPNTYDCFPYPDKSYFCTARKSEGRPLKRRLFESFTGKTIGSFTRGEGFNVHTTSDGRVSYFYAEPVKGRLEWKHGEVVVKNFAEFRELMAPFIKKYFMKG